MDQTRPRSKSAFSFRSTKSSESNHSRPKIADLQESEAEKRRTKLREGTKANPNAAINEAQPIAVASFEKSTLGSMRSIEFKDADGNVIIDPDRSNPARPRWERPLDTIRSFEKAIEGTYGQRPRTSMARTDVDSWNGYASRRTSYLGGYDDYQSGRMSQVGGYYGSRTPRPDSSYHDNYGPGGPRNRYTQRMNTEPMMHSTRNRHSNYPNNNANNSTNGTNVYPSHNHHQSYDTVGTGASYGSDATGPWGNSTDPSSENSSLDRVNASKPEQDGGWLNGFGTSPQVQASIPEEYGTGSHGPAYPQPPTMSGGRGDSVISGNMNGSFPPQVEQQALPPPPKHQDLVQRKLIKLNPTIQAAGAHVPQGKSNLSHQPSTEKKSWFKRRFTKN